MTSVSAILPTHNRRALVLEAVKTLVDQDYPEHLLEIIVVTDRCTDGTAAALVETFAERVRVLENRGSGGSAALNTGLSAATGDIVVTLDDDMLADPALVSAHAEAHQRAGSRRIAITGRSPVRLDQDSTPLHRYLAGRFDQFHKGLEKGDSVTSPASLALGNMSIARTALQEVGGFNEGYVHQRNDFELGTRLIEAGFEIHYCPEAVAFQQLALTGNVMVDRAVTRGLTDVRLLREHPWCSDALPFSRQLSNRGAARKWRLLWLGRGVLPSLLGLLRKRAPENLFLIRMEYAARYSVAVIGEAGGWSAFSALSGARE